MTNRNTFTKRDLNLTVSKSAWLWPLVILILGTPLWLHVWEPKLFLDLNRMFAVAPDVFWAFWTLIATGSCLVALSSVLAAFSPSLFVSWICTIPFLIFFSRLGKTVLLSPRPAEVIGVGNLHIIGEPLLYHSMPSGHTTAAFAMASAIFFGLPASKRWYFVWIFLVAILCGLSRIAVGAHWPGDVLVGMAAGLVSGMLGQYVRRYISVDNLYRNGWFRIIASVIILLCAGWLAYKPVAEMTLVMNYQYVIAVISVLCTLIFLFKSRGGA